MAWATPLTLGLPEYDVRSEQSPRASQGAIRSRLDSRVPGDIRMKSLLTLQAVPRRVANPILEDLLGDETDDVRMLAFGMLDAEEKKLTQHIQHERTVLEGTLSSGQRYDCLRRLAELHWELIYASLAQGELRKYMLDEANRYADAALTCANSSADGGLHFLRGRILMAQGVHEAAVRAIDQAVCSGVSEVSALPYLAEIAFRQQNFDAVHRIMQRLAELKPSGRTSTVVNLWTGQVDSAAYGNLSQRAQAIVDIWTGRDDVHNFCYHRILNHI
jgi:tetratricopeptide (TPR) repeat protein